MSRAEHTITIRRPAGEVFAFITDPANTPLWQPSVVDVRRLTDAPIVAGSRFVEVRRLLGRSVESVFEVTDLDPPHRSAVTVVDGPITGHASYALREIPDGTELRFAYQMDAAGVFKVAEQLVTRLLVREFDASLGHLKDLLEARIGGATPSPGTPHDLP
ncbi:SRPBCC family protein [Nitriliruptor alkaliphilus]|uniref:SRPBCC family protein n=1 Tax=Nitriliruptor alkaliphilus TaxID=427918 RepID=UPI000697DB45|nr:SRPBCC family protein [Nitriliruptor alkaliphilus]